MLMLTTFPASSLSLEPATQTVPETYRPITTPVPSGAEPAPLTTIPLGSDEAPRAESPTPTPTPGPTATPRPTPRATPTARPAATFASTSSITGTATWYAAWYMHTGDLVGAAGPLIRVGSWRGRIVQVCSGSSCVNVKLVDWCACGDRGSLPNLIDLSPAAFSSLAPLSRGVIRVEVSW